VYPASTATVSAGSVYCDANQYTTTQNALTAAAANETVIVHPGGPTDVPNGSRIGSLLVPTISSQTNQTHLVDWRYGTWSDSMFNPGFDNLTNIWSARNWITNWNQSMGNGNNSPTSGANQGYMNLIQSNFLSGTQNVNQSGGYFNKSNLVSLFVMQNTWSSAQDNVFTVQDNKLGSGDALATFFSSFCFGPSSGNSDEGCEGTDYNVAAGYVDMEGTVTGSPATGATSVTVTPTQGSGTQGVGRFVLDLTQGTNAGTITSFSGSGLVTVTGSGTSFGTSAAHTTTTAAITVTGSNLTPGSVNVPVSSSTGISVNDVICIASAASEFESVLVTAVPDGTHVTASFQFPHDSGATIGDGGGCGKAIDIVADDYVASGGVGFVVPQGTLYQAWPVIYSTSATSAVVWIADGGSGDSYSGGGVFPSAAYHYYPAVRTLAVNNGGPTVSNTLTLMPNTVAWANSDVLDVETGPAIKMNATGNWQFAAFHGQMGNGAYRAGPAYDGLFTGSSWGWGVQNNTAFTKYSGHSGGFLVPLAGYWAKGLFNYGIYFDTVPDRAVVEVGGCPVNSSGTRVCSGQNEKILEVANSSSSTDYFEYQNNANFWTLSFNNGASTCIWGQNSNAQVCSVGIGANGVTPTAQSGAVSFPEAVGYVSCTNAGCPGSGSPGNVMNFGTFATALYEVTIEVECTAAVSSATVNATLNYTDINGHTQTVTPTSAATCTTLANSTDASRTSIGPKPVFAETSTPVTYFVTTTNTPTGYRVTVIFHQVSTS
jgi:hypothetical protein